ncbi:SAM-dependent chlorinase/fluorinase [Streptomyces sp. NBC_01217]|uniref:SAM-dependent chlorinase/fluorinase n=1 Tax=Streptomyces sp. NBC_01217 TaxID=2903779 RepID=UPI002E0DCCB4|nr:SAM-dependent chlorinase/fluorinase [Streptomyces sp. NBC_01217]
MMERVVIVSDCTDVAFLELRSAIFSATRAVEPPVSVEIEPLVAVEPFSVLNAAFLTRLVAELAWPGTLIMCVVNSLRERTERLIVRTEKHGLLLVGANTGALGWLTSDFGVAECVEMEGPDFVPFGGKYIHAPAVGALVRGVPPADLGMPFSEGSIRSAPLSDGLIVHVDNFGNAKFLCAVNDLRPGERLRVEVDGRYIEATYGRRMMDFDDGSWVVYPGSSLGLHELGQVRRQGAQAIGWRVGDSIHLQRI